MSRSALSCPGCGSSNIIDDDLYAQSQLVCVDCGAVVSEGSLADEHVEGSGVNFVHAVTSDKKPCPNLIKGLQRVKVICQTLRVHSGIESLSKSHYQQAYQHDTFIKVSLQKKDVLAGCCVLVSCRLLNWPVAMGTIACLVDGDLEMVGAVYKDVVKILNIEAPIVGVTDVMEAHVQEYKITSLHVPEELAENPKDLTKRAVALVELAGDAWIVTGRRPVPIMMAAIYLAWQSLKPTKQRLKFSLDKFCQIAKVNKHKPAVKRVAEMKEVLCKLGKEIPWVSGAVTPDNIALQVADVLQHRFTLLRRALRTHEKAQLDTHETTHGDSQTEDDFVKETSNSSSVEQHEEPHSKQGHGCDDTCTVSDPPGDGQKGQGSASNWGKRVLFAPPCVVNPKRRRTERPEPKDVTGDEEISDSEIDSYIRTPREARDFALKQKMLSEIKSQKSPETG